jgi:hypothetical protein
MHRRLVAALVLALFAPLCAAAQSDAASSTSAPVTYNPDTRPGNPYGGQAPKPRKKHHHVHVGKGSPAGSAVAESTSDTAPVTYNPDTRPGSPYATGTQKPVRKHRKCRSCR